MSTHEQLEHLTRGCVDVVRLDELRTKLERSQEAGKPLVVKVGFDPTAPDLHLGHTVLIRKMKHFQDLGHTVVYVVGDFTARIGDPTGRVKTRPALSPDEINRNAETYKQQIFKILDPNKTVTRFNSEWLGPLGSEGWIRLAATYNVARMLERRDFKQRYEEGRPIAIHEFLYPLAQAYDSVALKADVELGGTDQLFNLNVGRDIMPAFGLEAQVVMTTPLLEGLDGVEKMSKSLGNCVGVTDPPPEMFGKLMSISDELMWKYYALLTDLRPTDIQQLRQSLAVDVRKVASSLVGLRQAAGMRDEPLSPALRGLYAAAGIISDQEAAESYKRAKEKELKLELAERIVSDFHGPDAALDARLEFERRVVRKEQPEEMPNFEIRIPSERLSLRRILPMCELADSASDAHRKIEQGGVYLDGVRIALPHYRPEPGEHTIKVGPRKYARVRLKTEDER